MYFGTMAGWYSLSLTRVRSELRRFFAMSKSSDSTHMLPTLPFAWVNSFRQDDPMLHTLNCSEQGSRKARNKRNKENGVHRHSVAVKC